MCMFISTPSNFYFSKIKSSIIFKSCQMSSTVLGSEFGRDLQFQQRRQEGNYLNFSETEKNPSCCGWQYETLSNLQVHRGGRAPACAFRDAESERASSERVSIWPPPSCLTCGRLFTWQTVSLSTDLRMLASIRRKPAGVLGFVVWGLASLFLSAPFFFFSFF